MLTGGDSEATTTSDERWLAATWPFVRGQLPSAPAHVVEIGCGTLGGFVPAMRAAGYDAVGIDPAGPAGPAYHRCEFERYEPARLADAFVACTSLHHVADLRDAVDRIAAALVPGGRVIVVEWARERFDQQTAAWCFARLTPAGDDPGWLHHHRDQWIASGRSWDSYCETWANDEGLHPGRDILRALEARFDTRLCAEGPYFYADLHGVAAADEQAAIDAGQLQANGLRYVGRWAGPDRQS